jgi:hypothetical protein
MAGAAFVNRRGDYRTTMLLLPSRQFVSGHADYSDFRQFDVTTAE